MSEFKSKTVFDAPPQGSAVAAKERFKKPAAYWEKASSTDSPDTMSKTDKRLITSPYYKQFQNAEDQPVDASDYSYVSKKHNAPASVFDAPKENKQPAPSETKPAKAHKEHKMNKKEREAEAEMVSVDYSPEGYNAYNLNSTSRATPYYMSFFAAKAERPVYEEPIEPIIVDNRPKPKRQAFTVLTIVTMVIIIAALVLSFVGVVPEYTSLFNKGEETTIGLDDVIYGAMRKVFSMEFENESVYYNDCLAEIENAEIAPMIAYYALPVSLIITAIVAIYILIKAIVACATIKRRKFSYIALLLLLFTLFGVVAGLIWNGTELTLGNIVAFFALGNTEIIEGSVCNISVGIGYYILLGVEVLNLIFSFCTYRSKKKSKF